MVCIALYGPGRGDDCRVLYIGDIRFAVKNKWKGQIDPITRGDDYGTGI